jgi:hypothetical protein
MLKYTREAWPKTIVWAQSDSILKRNYWVEAEKPVNGGRIDAVVSGNTITIKATNQDEIALWLDQDLVDLSKPVTVVINGKSSKIKPNPNLETYCQGLEQTADPKLAAPVRVEIGQ